MNQLHSVRNVLHGRRQGENAKPACRKYANKTVMLP